MGDRGKIFIDFYQSLSFVVCRFDSFLLYWIPFIILIIFYPRVSVYAFT